MRLFVAIVPDTPLREALCKQMDFLRAAGLKGNFTCPKNLHLTLAFIGETSRVEDAVSCLDAVQVPAFQLSLCKLGRFPGNGGVYYAGVHPGCALFALAAQTAEALRAAGFVLEDRAFIPHITLCRARPENWDFDFPRCASAALDGGMWVDAVTLLHARHSQGKPLYTPLYRRALFPPECNGGVLQAPQ